MVYHRKGLTKKPIEDGVVFLFNVKDAWQLDQEYCEIVEDILNHEQVQELKHFVHHHFNNRLDHSIAVSYTSFLIAKKMNADYVSVARAGLLHDFFLLDVSSVEALGLGSHNDVHPRLALENARKITILNEIEEDIILKHMFLVSKTSFPKYLESYIVTMVDKYAALQDVLSPLSTRFNNRLIRTIYRFGAQI